MYEALLFPETTARNLHRKVADLIGLRIVSGEIQPGQALPPELRLCEMMSISRTALREAIRVLVGKGMLESRPRSGTRVRPSEFWNHLDEDVLQWRFETSATDTYLRKLFQLRSVIEPAAAALAAANAGEAERERLQAAHVQMAVSRTALNFAQADVEFHRSIYLATGNEFFWPIAQMLSLALRRSFEISAPGDHRERAIAEHKTLLDAISAGNPAEAHAAALVLLKHSEGDLVAILGHDPFAGGRAPQAPEGTVRS